MEDKPKLLVMYGYHADETFSIDVGRALELIFRNSTNVVVKQYDEQPDTVSLGTARYEQPEAMLYLQHFLKRFEPLPIYLDLHNTWENIEFEKKIKGEIPGIVIGYEYQGEKNERLNDALTAYCLERPYSNPLFSYREVLSWKPSRIWVDFLPHKVTIKESIEFTEELIELLQHYRNSP